MTLVLYLTLLLTAGPAISADFMHAASGSDGDCHCYSNITIKIESPSENQCLQLMLENERLKLELQDIQKNNTCEENSEESNKGEGKSGE